MSQNHIENIRLLQESWSTNTILALRGYCEHKISEWQEQLEVASEQQTIHRLQGRIKGIKSVLEDIQPENQAAQQRSGAYAV